jgi:hypothetical protein
MMGMIEEVFRLPLVPPMESTRTKLRKTLAELELIQVPVGDTASGTK